MIGTASGPRSSGVIETGAPFFAPKVELDARPEGSSLGYELFRTLGFDPRGVTSRADVEELPLLTRDIVRERYADLLDPTSVGKNLKKGTSGSTGTPLKFEYSQRRV